MLLSQHSRALERPLCFNAMGAEKIISHTCAVLLIASSIALAFYQVIDIDDVANGTLMYIAQAFLLAGSIFGLNYYILKVTQSINKQ